MSVQLQLFANNASSTLAIAINNTDTQLTVANGSLFPSPTGSQYFLVTLESSGIIEVVMVSSRTGNVLTIAGGLSGRAQEGTAAGTFPQGTIVECRVTKGTLSSFLPLSSYLPYTATTTLSAPSVMTSSAYIAGVDDGGAGIIAGAISNTAWSFPSMSTTTYTGNATTGTVTRLDAALLPTSGTNGKYIVQFTSGANQGYVRPITGYGAGYVTWATALPNAVSTDGYMIYQSNYSLILAATGGSSADDALVYAIAFGS